MSSKSRFLFKKFSPQQVAGGQFLLVYWDSEEKWPMSIRTVICHAATCPGKLMRNPNDGVRFYLYVRPTYKLVISQLEGGVPSEPETITKHREAARSLL